MTIEYIEEILKSLRFFYPNLTISIIEKDDEGRLIVGSENSREKTILKYNVDLMDMQIKDNTADYIKTLIRQFSEIIERKYLKNINMFYKSNVSSGRRSKIINKSQLLYAIENSNSCRGAARLLGVHVDTFKKYCYRFDPELYDNHTNKTGRGIKKGGRRPKVSLEDIFSGKNVNFKVFWLKDRLINENLLEERCSMCGYEERRETDGKVPLILDFKDGDTHNRSLDNLRFLCYNCSFIIKPTNSKRNVRRLKEIKDLYDMEKDLFEKEVNDKLFDEFNKTPDVDTKKDVFDKFNT